MQGDKYCRTLFNERLKLVKIRCDECPCGYYTWGIYNNLHHCHACFELGCVIKAQRRIIPCSECPYGGYYQENGAYICYVGCRRIVGNSIQVVNCDTCPCGVNGQKNTVYHDHAYCYPCGCQCGNNLALKPLDAWSCKACGCKCGQCISPRNVQSCCACGCKCGHWYEPPSFADLLSPTGWLGWRCSHCKCFPSTASVSLQNGTLKTMAELEVGDRVQAGNDILIPPSIFNMLVLYKPFPPN